MKITPPHQARLLRASALVFVVLAAHAQAADRAPPDVSQNAVARPAFREYSVVNLVSLEGLGILNGGGQVAFTGYAGGQPVIGFFDGRRLHDVRLPVSRFAPPHVHALNDGGMAIIEANNPDTGFPFNARAFSWSLARGGRLLTGSGAGLGRAVNGRHQIAGYIQAGEHSGRAVRWNADGSRTVLGAAPAGYSEAMAINDTGMTAGYVESRAAVWTAQGGVTDLGNMGGTGAIASFLNARGQAAGTFNRGVGSGVFVWDRQGGLVSIGPFDRPVRVTGFNDASQVAANRQVGQEGLLPTFAPFIWSAAQGVKTLPLAGAAHGRVDGLNRRAEMVGYTQRVAFDEGSKRAVYWSNAWNDAAVPVDLNTRLYRAPAGLVLSAATAINDDGTILAISNAGLVLLRPGRIGTDAPVLGPLRAPPEAGYATVGNTLEFAINFVDSNPAESHVASASVNDGCPQTAPSLREARGSGDVSLRHTFCRAGFHSLRITITDRAGNATRSERQIAIGEASTLRR